MHLEALIGIDGFFIGPYDLTASMGIAGDFENKDFQSALKEVETACHSNNKSLGIHVVAPDRQLLQEKIEAGYNILAFSTDFLFLRTKIMETVPKGYKV